MIAPSGSCDRRLIIIPFPFMRLPPSLIPAALAFAAIPLFSFAQYKMQTPVGEAPGPWIFGTIGVGKGADGKPLTTALKGLAIKLGENGEAGIAYDLDLCRVAGVWTGGKFVTPSNLMSRGEYPTTLGEVVLTTGEVPGFNTPEAREGWKDPRVESFGPLPTGQVRFKGFSTGNQRFTLTWNINGCEIQESPSLENHGGAPVVVRSLTVAPRAFNLRIGASLTTPYLNITPSKEQLRVKILTYLAKANGPNPIVEIAPAGNSSDQQVAKEVPRWPNLVETSSLDVESPKIAIGNPSPAYVVDNVKLPYPNPWSAPMFVGGFDFFPDGRAALCTFHGDVFVVSGLERDLKKVTWRRYASGLYHALGLKIVKGDIHVTCRDGLWRLKDLNEDGECDLYEAFNFDVKVTKSFHEFVFDLQTDAAGNFYFAKAGPVKNGGRGFDEIMAHHGTLMRVSPDGSKLDVVATGFRAPNGIGIGPKGELTSGDNEGTWTPTCKINWIKPGGFYGVVDLAHRNPAPTSYDPPLCWLPKRVDNSGGSQVWVPDDERWGPWRGQMLHLSYGHAALYGVLREDVNGIVQGGVTRFPLKFESGIMRARFHPKDGQLWVAGMRGWQTDGIRNGCLQRVRYTGAAVQMPIELHAKKNGVELRFTSSIDTQSAIDLENWNVEVWNYLWSEAYGSPEISTFADAEKPAESGQFSRSQMTKAQHDPMKVKSISVGTDDRSVFLEIEGMKPVMQMAITYAIKSADGSELKGEVVNTVHVLGE